MDEKRHEVRERSYLGASLALNCRSSAMACVVRNLTAAGAMISFSDAVPLPQDIDLVIPARGLNLRARVMWRGDGALGVSFLNVPRVVETDSVISLNEVRRLKECRKENDALKRRIEELTSGI